MATAASLRTSSAQRALRVEHRRVAAADPLNLRGILTPEERVTATARRWIEVG